MNDIWCLQPYQSPAFLAVLNILHALSHLSAIRGHVGSWPPPDALLDGWVGLANGIVRMSKPLLAVLVALLVLTAKVRLILKTLTCRTLSV